MKKHSAADTNRDYSSVGDSEPVRDVRQEESNLVSPDFLPFGTEIKPYGKVVAIGILADERYYWFDNGDRCISMMPLTSITQKSHNEEK